MASSSGSLTFHKRSTLAVFKFKSTWRASDPKKRPSFNGHPGPSSDSIPLQHFKRISAFRQKFRQCQKVARIQRTDQFRGRKFLKNGIWQQYRITLFVFKPPIICPWSCHNAMLSLWGIMSFLCIWSGKNIDLRICRDFAKWGWVWAWNLSQTALIIACVPKLSLECQNFCRTRLFNFQKIPVVEEMWEEEEGLGRVRYRGGDFQRGGRQHVPTF